MYKTEPVVSGFVFFIFIELGYRYKGGVEDDES